MSYFSSFQFLFKATLRENHVVDTSADQIVSKYKFPLRLPLLEESPVFFLSL